jgi:hypothetical protein
MAIIDAADEKRSAEPGSSLQTKFFSVKMNAAIGAPAFDAKPLDAQVNAWLATAPGEIHEIRLAASEAFVAAFVTFRAR